MPGSETTAALLKLSNARPLSVTSEPKIANEQYFSEAEALAARYGIFTIFLATDDQSAVQASKARPGFRYDFETSRSSQSLNLEPHTQIPIPKILISAGCGHIYPLAWAGLDYSPPKLANLNLEHKPFQVHVNQY